MRIVFMGTPNYAVQILSTLHNSSSYEVVGIVTQPDKPVGRKKTLTAPPVKIWQATHASEVSLHQPSSLKTTEALSFIKSCKPEIIVVAAFGQILPEAVLSIAPCINLHASLLPKFRGASPIQRAILEKEKYTGVTSMLMDKGLDTGAMLGFLVTTIAKDTTSAELFETLGKAAASLTIKTLDLWDKSLPIVQKNALSSYAGKITKEDGEISFNLTADEIWTYFRALAPWPGIFLTSGLKILDCKPSQLSSAKKAGTILKIEKEGAHIACKDGTIFIVCV
ncbi:MAG: methionyl-tRNA formyltransferase, partial [Campylobacteraceae bacterium]|nr:methionyl-tRNA formyltransferase [Campylobacteraceae bacterium]